LKSDGTFLVSGGDNARKGYKLSSVSGLGVNPITDDIWVCDQKGNKVVRFSPEGEALLKITDKVKYPMDVTIDRQGNAFVVMTKKPEIYKYDSSGEFLAKIGGSGKAALLFPTSILFADNHLYVTDFGGARVLKLTLSGELVSEFKAKGEYEDMLGPSSMHVDKNGNLYILDLGEVPVVVLQPNGELISKIGSFGNEKGKFLYPRGIIALPNEEILVLDNSRNCILTFKRKPESK
jgi:sugar lactone lactonase YvrE